MTEPIDFEERNRLRAIVNKTTELAPLKAVATTAVQMAEDERSATMDLATVISSDQALTAKLLRLSNSAYYGYARRSNVREAVILLGMRTVLSVARVNGGMRTIEDKARAFLLHVTASPQRGTPRAAWPPMSRAELKAYATWPNGPSERADSP